MQGGDGPDLVNDNAASLVAQSVKNLPAVQETWVLFLGREDPLDKEMATHSSILACRIPCTEEPGRLQSMGLQESDMTERLNHHQGSIKSSASRISYSFHYLVFVRSVMGSVGGE